MLSREAGWRWSAVVIMKIESMDEVLGHLIKTHDELGSTRGFFIAEKHLDARRASAVGIVTGWVPGHGGDVYWVRHEESDDPVAAYTLEEMEFA